MRIDIENIILLGVDLNLGKDGWRIARKHEVGLSTYLPAGRLQFDYMYWVEGEKEDNHPAYGFKMLDNIGDRNYPEFFLSELKKFLRNGVMEII